MNKAQSKSKLTKVLSLILALVMVLSLMPLMGAASQTASDNTASDSSDFMRIFHLDCGRKYFTVAQIEELIDTAAANNYTHVELAFGNDGLRFLLEEMSVTVGDKTYSDGNVTKAVQFGNDVYDESAEYTTTTDELTETEMDAIIRYANGKGIGIIPMFDAPGHLYAVISAMKDSLGFTMTENNQYSLASTSGSSKNWAINPTYTEGKDFVLALMNKYITYFAKKGCQYFNFAADECGFTKMSAEQYTAYAKFVNSMASAVKSANMTPMAFNDGIYYINLTLNDNVSFDTGIYICYWDASTAKYAQASELASKGFKIINTHNKWYYVIGKTTEWYGSTWSKENMQGTSSTSTNNAAKCDVTDGGYTTTTGCMNAVWCDNPSVSYDTYSSTIKDHIATLANVEYNKTFFVDSSSGTDGTDSSDADKNTETEEEYDKLVTVTVNANSDSYTVEGSYAGTTGEAVPIDDYASYTVTKNDGTAASATPADSITGGEYIIGHDDVTSTWWLTIDDNGNVSSTPNLNEATKWTITPKKAGSTKYYISSSSDSYLNINTNNYKLSLSENKMEWKLDSSKGFYYESVSWNKTTKYYIYDGKGHNSELGDGFAYTKTDATEASTTVTFTGLQVGESKVVTIGNTKYKVKVIQEDLSNASALPIQTWITNAAIQMDNVTTKTSGTVGGFKYGYYVKVSASDAYGVDGAELSKLVPETKSDVKEYGGVYWDVSFQNAGKVETTSGSETVNNWNTRPARTLDLLKGTCLSSGSYQTIWGSNQVESGTDFKYVRYYQGAWAVSSDRVDWTPVEAGTATTVGSSGSGTQIVAYYMLRTDVTKEVTTDVIDWGNATPTSESKVILDYAVKYENGSLVPSSFPNSGKTMFFNMLSGNNSYRRIYDIKGLEQSGYEIYMITVTPSSDSSSDTISISSSSMPTYSYKGTEKVAWVASNEDLPSDFKDKQYTSISGAITYKVGGEPTISGVEIYPNQAMLVTYYIRAVKTTDSLTVHYVNKVTGKEIHFYNINVISTAENPTLFDEDIALAEPWKGDLVNGTVVNDMGENITVSADLSTMPAIAAEYRFSNYECVEVKTSNDLKDVYLYYTFSYDTTYVVDYGLPVTIKPTDLSSNISDANIKKVVVSASSYANVKENSDHSITYELKEAISAADNFTVTYYGTNLTTANEGQITFNVRIIPATSVYYEDSFATFTDGSEANWTTETDDVTQTSTTQALEALGSKTNVYGTDNAYSNSTKYSMGSAHKVTVTSAMAATTGVTWPTATFSFTGTGFDIISLTDNNSGAISVKVYKASDNTQVKGLFVNNYYGYDYNSDTKTWSTTENANPNALYQIPVIKVNGLDYDTYKVVITVGYESFADYTNDKQYSFWLDAIRVYNPMGKDVATYAKDGEGYSQYIKLRDELAKKASPTTDSSIVDTTGNNVFFIDGAEGADVATYANYGPNNEVYLANGQAISFTIPADLSNLDTVQIGAKSPSGSATMSVTVGETKKTPVPIGAATEMYYILDATAGQQVTITSTGTNILSLTNLKLTFTSNPSTEAVALTAMNEEEQTVAVMAVRALFAAPMVETFEPETFEASWNSVRKGQTATLTVKTSEDVESIMVDGEEVTDYNTHTERNGFGWWAEKVTYRVFTYTVTAEETKDYTITAFNDAGAESDAITATLTVKESGSSWWSNLWNNFFGRWF